jgi:hypothetical protein
MGTQVSHKMTSDDGTALSLAEYASETSQWVLRKEFNDLALLERLCKGGAVDVKHHVRNESGRITGWNIHPSYCPCTLITKDSVVCLNAHPDNAKSIKCWYLSTSLNKVATKSDCNGATLYRLCVRADDLLTAQLGNIPRLTPQRIAEREALSADCSSL